MTARIFYSGFLTLLLTGGNCLYAAPPVSPTPHVLVDQVQKVHASSPRAYVGMIETIKHVDVMPRVTGTLLKIAFTEGSMVQQGDLLYELESTTYQSAVDGLKAQKEALEAALKYADSEYQRNTKLLKNQAVSVSLHEKAVLEINSARAKLKDIDAALVNAENTLSYTKIYAPLTGRIGKSSSTEGNLITPGGGKLTDIEMVAPIYVRFSLSERVFRRDFGGMAAIREKAVIRIKLADGSIYPERANLTLIDNKINPSSNTITVWATLENRDGQLLSGSFVTVLLSTAVADGAIAVTPSALIAGDNGYSVYILDGEDKIVRREVKTGDIAGNLQMIESGLDGSERVVVDGMHKVQPGMKVIPVAPEKEKTATTVATDTNTNI